MRIGPMGGDIDLDHAQLALGQIPQLDLLDGHGLASAPVERLVNRAERPLADAIAESLSHQHHNTSAQPILFRGMVFGLEQQRT